MKINRQITVPAISTSRWLAYAAAGAASALSGAGSAEGEIHYSGVVNFNFPGTNHATSAYFPLNSSARLFFQHFNVGLEGAARLQVVGPNGEVGSSSGGMVGKFIEYGGFYISNLPPHVSLPQLRFGAYCKLTSSSQTECFGGTIGYTHRPNGKFRSPGKGYIGFTFDSGQGSQYGWARIRTAGAPNYQFILIDYAWADPGETIQTGQKHGSDRSASVPIAPSLGLLALGDRGLMACRNCYQQDPMQ